MSTEFDNRPVFTNSRKEQERIRMQVVKMYRKGMSATDLAATFEIMPRARLQWVATFINCGQNRLLAKEVSGRPPKLNAEQLRRLALLVHEHRPNQLSFDFGLWTLRLIV